MKILRYLKAKEAVTGSSTSKIVYVPASSDISRLEALIVVCPDPISPFTENLTDSFVVSMITVSEI